jgi:hypothetical protein
VELSEVVEDFNDFGMLGYGFTSVNELEEIDLGDRSFKRLTYISAE